MDGGVVIEGARNCIPNSRLAVEHEEAWRRVSQDPSWMHSCDHMWHLISLKLTELKETRDQNAGIVVRGAAAPADKGAVFDGYVPAAGVGLEVAAMARGMYFGAPPLAPRVANPVAPHVPFQGPRPGPPPGQPPASKNFHPLGRMDDRVPDESRRTGRDHFKIPAQPRRQEESTDVAGARILKSKEAYMTRPPAPPQARDRVPEPRINGVRKDLPRDDAKKGREVELRRAAAAGGRWKGVVEERKEVVEEKGLTEGRREERTGLAEDRKTLGENGGEESKGTVTVAVEDTSGGVVERQEVGEERQEVVKEERAEEPMAQAIVEVGEKRKRDGDTDRRQGPEKRSRDSDGEVPTAPKDVPKNDKLQVVLFRTEGGRAVHVGEKAEQKSDHSSVTTTDPARAEEAPQEAGKYPANEGAEAVSPLETIPDVMDESSSEPQVVMCNRKDMPTSSAGDPLPIKRKRRMDEVMEDGKPAKRPGIGQTFRAVKHLREVHQEPPVPAQDATRAKPTIAENANVSKPKVAPAPSVTYQATKAKAAENIIPVKTKPHVIQITSIDMKAKKKKPDPEEPELEFKCGCTSKELGDTVGHLKVYKSGELVIFCECKAGCPEAGKPLSPSGFERHAGRGAAKKWKNTIWLVVGNEKVPLYKVKAMEPYVEKNKGRKNLIKT